MDTRQEVKNTLDTVVFQQKKKKSYTTSSILTSFSNSKEQLDILGNMVIRFELDERIDSTLVSL